MKLTLARAIVDAAARALRGVGSAKVRVVVGRSDPPEEKTCSQIRSTRDVQLIAIEVNINR